MRKLKLFFACLLMAVLSIGQVWATETELFSQTYPGSPSGYPNSYTGSYTLTTSGYTLTYANINNGTKAADNWTAVRAGRKNNASVASITTGQIATAVSKVTITFTQVNADLTNKLYLEVADNESFTSATKISQTIAQSEVAFTISSPAANQYYRIMIDQKSGTSNGFTRFSGVAFYYNEGGTPTCATPTFSPAAGVYTSAQSVTLSCETASSTIYYTTDGSDPDNTKTQYTGAINVDETTTIKAIAYVGSSASNVASATYTIVTPLNTMDAIFAAATAAGSTATDVYIDFQNWVVSGAKGNTAYVTDGTKGFIVYYSGHGFNEGDILSGTGSFKLKLYSGAAEITAKNSGTITATPGGSATLNVLDADGIAALSGINTGSLIKISGAATSTDVVAGIKLYKTIYPASSLPSLSVGANYNCTGVYVQYSETKEMMPRKAADIEEAITKYTVSYEASPANGSLAIYDGSDLIAAGSKVNEGTVLTIETTPATDYTLDGVTVNGSAYTESTLTLTEDVTIAATFKVNTAPEITSYVLSENGTETDKKAGQHVGDKDNLPLTAASCSKTFVGWSANASCTVAPEYAPGAEITLEANNKFYAVYADANVVAPTDHALGSLTVGGTSGNTASEGYTYTSNKTNDKAGYTQDSGTKDADIIHLQIKAESQIINEEPSAIIVTAHLGAGADRETLTYPVNAVLVDADGANVGDPVVLTNSIPDKNGDDFSVELPTANYADVRGVKISHMKEDGWNVRYYSMSFKYQTGGTTYDNYSTDCQAQVATPVIAGVSPSGVYTEAKEITITCATDGATIYYAVDSDEEPSTEYTGAFTVGTDGAHTVKAKAVKTDMAASEIASVSFTINLPVVLSTIPAIFEAATSTQTEVNIVMDNWVVSGVGTDEKTVYVTDGTNGFIIYNSDHGFAVGDILSGTITCDLKKYKGAAELIGVTTSTTGLSVATGGTITPAAVAPADLAGVNTGALISLSSWKYDGSNLTNGTTEIQPYTTLYNFGETFVEDNYYNVSGIYLQFDSKKEILPRSADDIEEVSLSDPEISYTPASATIELGEELPGTVFANPHDLEITFSSNNEEVATVNPSNGVITLKTETGTAVITASFAGNATYAAANVTYTITVTPASVTENVVILAVYDTKYYAMSTTNASSAFTAIEVEYDGSQVTVNSAEDKAAIQWTKKTSGDNTTFQDANSKYMKSADGTSMSLQDAVCNWIWDESGFYKISGTTRTFFYQSGTGFKNFATSNFNKSGYSDKAQVIVIDPANIVITSKVSAELAYDPESDEITEGDAWSAPTLVNPHSVTITSYASDNEAVATVEGGVIALAGGIGTAHITAHFDGDATYLEGDAVYTITVNAAPEPAEDCDGSDDFLDTEDKGNPTSYKDRSTPNGWSAVNAGYKVIDEKAYWMINGKTTAVGVITSPELAGGLGSLKFRYANTNSESNGVSVKIEIKQGGDVVKEYTLTKPNSEVVQNTVYTELIENINIAGTFQIVITNLSPSNNTGNKDRVSIGRFCWSSYSAPEPVYETVRGSLTAGNYYTVCYNKTMTAIKGASLWSFAGKDANMAYIVAAEAPYVAGTPYIIYAESDKLEAVVEEVASPVAGSNNGLYGTFDYMDANALLAAGATYMLKNNALCPIGTNNHLNAQRAYVILNSIQGGAPANVPGKKVRSMPLQKDAATGMDELNASETPVKVMINGQMYILRGDKMFDATGRLVK